jgi:hypothetical protein
MHAALGQTVSDAFTGGSRPPAGRELAAAIVD